MGSFTTQPSGAQAVYHPIKYIFSHTSALAIESVRFVITLTDANSSTFTYTVRIPYTTKVSVGGGNFTYTFSLDASAFCKQKLPPFTYQVSSAFRFGVVNYSDIDNPDFWISIGVVGYPEYRNAQGVLTDEVGGSGSSTSFRVLPASYHRTDTKNLTNYTAATGGFNKFLTKRPSGSEWCLNSENSLSLYNSQYKTVSGTDIIFYWEALTWTGSTPSPQYLSTVVYKGKDGQVTVPLNTLLNNLPTNITKIKVSMLRGIGSTYTRFSEEYEIIPVRNCCSGTTFSWLNELGGVDSYTFCGELETQFSVSNEYGQQYDDGITTRLKGIYKTSSEVGEVINVRDLLSAADLDWIKYILASHEVYVKIGSAWYNCVITDASAITESNIEGMYDFSFTARLSDVVVNHN